VYYCLEQKPHPHLWPQPCITIMLLYNLLQQKFAFKYTFGSIQENEVVGMGHFKNHRNSNQNFRHCHYKFDWNYRHLSTLTLFHYEKCRSNAQLLEKYLSCPLNNLHISRLRRPQYQMSMEQQVKTTCKLRDYHPWQCTHPDLTGLVCTLEG